MNKALFKILFIIITVMLTSCKELFFPDEIISSEKIPVIQGMIHENSQPEATLNWATGYEETSVTYINDAQVWVTDDAGDLEEMEQISPGKYRGIHPDYKGISGRTYTLHAVIPSGLEYESTPEKINPAVGIDTLYAVPTEKEVYTASLSGDFIYSKQEGLDIKVDLNRTSDTTSYLRFKTDYVTEITYTLNPNSLFPTMVYKWLSSILDNVYSVGFTYTMNGRQILPEHKLGFLRFEYNPALSTDESTAPYTNGWIVSLHGKGLSILQFNCPTIKCR